MKGIRGIGSALRRHAELCVTLVAFALLIAIVVIWVVSSAGLWATRDYGLLIAAVVAFPLAFWRSRVAERQAATAQQSLLNERYQQSAAMLGSDVLSVRLGGIYALQRLAEEHPEQYHIQIMRLFCAFARHPTKDESEGTDDIRVHPHTELRQDVQAIMAAISVRNRRQIQFEKGEMTRLIDLSGADLSNAELVHTNLNNARLIKSNLSGATILTANLFWADLTGGNLSGTTIWHTDLSNANLKCANLSGATLYGADFSETRLQDAILTDARLSLSHGPLPATGLTQAQLDLARANPDSPPNLNGAIDAETGKLLIWRGKPLDDKSD